MMSAIAKEQVKMKPRWYFVLGSVLMTGGLTGLVILSIFVVSVVSFSLCTHIPAGNFHAIHYKKLLSTFPWGAVAVAGVGIGFGILLLKKYDFSYRKNFLLIILSGIVAILFAGWLVNYTGLDTIWMKRGPMRDFYHRYDGGAMMGGSGWCIMHNNGL